MLGYTVRYEQGRWTVFSPHGVVQSWHIEREVALDLAELLNEVRQRRSGRPRAVDAPIIDLGARNGTSDN